MAHTNEATTSSTQPAQPIQIDVTDLGSHVGQKLGSSSWWTITQEHVNGFADATGDHQWIHVDPERAKTGPFGQTIAHGFMTLGMSVGMLFEVVEITGAAMILNYGVNRVRFPAPLPVGSKVRATVELAALDEVAGGVQTTFRVTVDMEGGAKPVCAADILFRYYQSWPEAGGAGRNA